MRRRRSPLYRFRRLRRERRRRREMLAVSRSHADFYERVASTLEVGLNLRVLGVQRSGNHAVISWILHNAPEPVLFLNHVRPRLHPNPLVGFGRASYRSGSAVEEYGPQSPTRWEDVRRVLAGTPTLGTVIHSYEDYPLDEDSVRRLDASDRWLGTARSSRDVIVCRDPFNLCASRLCHDWIELSPGTLGLWKQHAREVLGRTALLTRPASHVRYNRWCHDEGYRRDLAGALGLTGDRRGRDVVMDTGGGSTFGGRSASASELRSGAGERWRACVGDRFYRRLVSDPEVRSLAREIFGELAADAAVGAA